MHPAFQARQPREAHPPPQGTLVPAATAVVLCLTASIAAAVSCIVNSRDMRRLAGTVGDGSLVDEARVSRDLHHHHVLDWVALGCAGATLLLVVVWAMLANRNSRPRTSGAWAVALGWLIPMINLWSPPRMLLRIRTAQVRAQHRTARSRAHGGLIYLWWLLLLAAVALVSFIAIDEPHALTERSAEHERHILALTITQASVWIACALVLLAVVAVMTRTNEQLRRSGRMVDVELPVAPVTPLGLRPPSVSPYPSSIFPVAVHPSDPRWKPEPRTGERGYWK